MIYYHNQIYDGELVLSVDNFVLDVSISRAEIRDLLENIIQNIASAAKLSVLSWESRKPGTFRYQTAFKVDDDRSFWLGHGLIGSGTLVDRYRLEANPNKVGNDPNFRLIHEFLVRNSREILCHITRFDLAIDIPVDRSLCFLVKDRRLYIERRHGVEFTQYLGSKASNVGRVKLYNKTAEAKLNYPLTRLELTLDPSKSYEEICFPKVYVIDRASMAMDRVRLSETDRFILNAIFQGCGKITDLGRKMGEKIEHILDDYLGVVEITKDSYDQILEQIRTYSTNSATMTKKENNYEYL